MLGGGLLSCLPGTPEHLGSRRLRAFFSVGSLGNKTFKSNQWGLKGKQAWVKTNTAILMLRFAKLEPASAACQHLTQGQFLFWQREV